MTDYIDGPGSVPCSCCGKPTRAPTERDLREELEQWRAVRESATLDLEKASREIKRIEALLASDAQLDIEEVIRG